MQNNRQYVGVLKMGEMRSVGKLADVEKKHILDTLAACEGNRTRAALALGISIRCLRNKLHLYLDEGDQIPEPISGVMQSDH